MLRVAIGGLAAMPTVGSVIAGATSVEQVRQNVAAGLWAPSGEDLDELLTSPDERPSPRVVSPIRVGQPDTGCWDGTGLDLGRP